MENRQLCLICPRKTGGMMKSKAALLTEAGGIKYFLVTDERDFGRNNGCQFRLT